MTVAVEAHGVAKRFGRIVAVEDLTFTVEQGEILGVLGPNGAGKTTAIRVLTTILEPTGGTFAVGGVGSERAAEIRALIGVLPESAGYPERQTGEEFLRYHARLFGHGRASARATAASLLAEVGLAGRARSLIGGYSRGMRQRIGIARTLVNEPQVVFLDEPTLGLDPAGQRQILGLIRRIARERGATVLLSTHLLAEVEESCSRVLILDRGRVRAMGTVAEVAAQAAAPRSARVRVAPENLDRVAATLRRVPQVRMVEVDGDQPGMLTVLMTDGANNDAQVNDGLRALAEAGIPLLFFELEGARLSDAFLAITEGS